MLLLWVVCAYGVDSSCRPLKATHFKTPPMSNKPPPIQATKRAGPNVNLGIRQQWKVTHSNYTLLLHIHTHSVLCFTLKLPVNCWHSYSSHFHSLHLHLVHSAIIRVVSGHHEAGYNLISINRRSNDATETYKQAEICLINSR